MSDTLIKIDYCDKCLTYKRFSKPKYDGQALWVCMTCDNKQQTFKEYTNGFGVAH